MSSFSELGVGEKVLKSIEELGYKIPTPVQQQAIPVLLKNQQDFLGLAQTGTGKTAAFGLPLIELLETTSKVTQALILAPTRELCMQISNDLADYSKYHPFTIAAVYGGASIERQIQQIKRGAQMIVATPGRLIDLIGRKVINLKAIKFVILDEADEMLNMGFQEDIDSILIHTPPSKRVWLFSATMPAEVREIADSYMHNPFELVIGKKNVSASNIEHRYYVVQERDRYAALKRIIDAEPEIFAIVFARTRLDVQKIAEDLIRDGYNADSLHGDLSQQQRDKVMNRYRNHSLQILVATDVAARGIDVDDVTHVIHFHLPEEAENYAHRSGRTARAGKSGISIALVNSRETGKIRQIEKKVNALFRISKIPDVELVCEQQLLKLVRKIKDVEVDTAGIAKYLPVAFNELSSLTREELIERFISLEFNRFLDYYRNAPELKSGYSHNEEKDRGDHYHEGIRLFINLGSMDGFKESSLRNYISETASVPAKNIGNIILKGVYSFVYVPVKYLPIIVESFTGETYKGRNVRIEEGGRRTDSDSRKSKQKVKQFQSEGKGKFGRSDRNKEKKSRKKESKRW
ncbi:MAG: DEAD/DEAH box helicase [Bacteroidia bacterium]|nr:DEAD/DEAH box helicase [Bacteroidia bacterium]MCZ2276762.1 DEAD/DEAH box helicase [Bacteroidia bacterium]